MNSPYHDFESCYNRTVFTQLGETRQARAAQRLEQKMRLEADTMKYNAQQTKITDLPIPGIKDRLKATPKPAVKVIEVAPGRKFR